MNLRSVSYQVKNKTQSLLIKFSIWFHKTTNSKMLLIMKCGLNANLILRNDCSTRKSLNLLKRNTLARCKDSSKTG